MKGRLVFATANRWRIRKKAKEGELRLLFASRCSSEHFPSTGFVASLSKPLSAKRSGEDGRKLALQAAKNMDTAGMKTVTPASKKNQQVVKAGENGSDTQTSTHVCSGFASGRLAERHALEALD